MACSAGPSSSGFFHIPLKIDSVGRPFRGIIMGCKTYDFNGDYSLRCCEQACSTPETKHVGHEHHLQLHELSVSDEKKIAPKKKRLAWCANGPSNKILWRRKMPNSIKYYWHGRVGYKRFLIQTSRSRGCGGDPDSRCPNWLKLNDTFPVTSQTLKEAWHQMWKTTMPQICAVHSVFFAVSNDVPTIKSLRHFCMQLLLCPSNFKFRKLLSQ